MKQPLKKTCEHDKVTAKTGIQFGTDTKVVKKNLPQDSSHTQQIHLLQAGQQAIISIFSLKTVTLSKIYNESAVSAA